MNQSQAANTALDLSRRLIRVLGAQPAHVRDAEATTSAARLLYDRLRRVDSSASWFAENEHSPLVVVGSGPRLLVCYLDDADPFATTHRGEPPTFQRGAISSPGIARKAAVIAAVTRYVIDRDQGLWTLAIETDRHEGSAALQAWMAGVDRDLDIGIWEASDLPIEKPAVFRGSMGSLRVAIVSSLDHGRTESAFGSVIPDLAHLVSRSIADLKTPDHEVLLDGFYDNVITPDDEELTALASLGEGISEWLARVAPGESLLPRHHLTMGTFLAPSLIVRDVAVESSPPYLPTRVRVRLEANVTPGQSPARVLDSLVEHFRARQASVQIDTEFLAQPTLSSVDGDELRRRFDLVLPVSPTLSPASVLSQAGLETIGYSTIGRSAKPGAHTTTLEQILEGAEHIRALGTIVSDWTDRDSS